MEQPPARILIRDVRGVRRPPQPARGHALVVGDKIDAVTDEAPPEDDATVIDGGGRVLMPGRTDAMCT